MSEVRLVLPDIQSVRIFAALVGYLRKQTTNGDSTARTTLKGDLHDPAYGTRP